MKTTLPPNNNDQTVMLQRTPTTTSSAEMTTTPYSQNALPIGTTLGEFEILGVIGEGGFGIVYLAYDHSLHRQVALKEYMPSVLAARQAGATVAVKSQRHTEAFQAGLRSFVNEARLLAQFNHPSLVKVYRFWEDNGTAYMVMPFYEGVTLKEALRVLNTSPDEVWLKSLLAQLLDALEVIHKEQCFHRDISPDNILILKNGHPLLLDFGAARRVISGMTMALTVILKPGYAPVEQYADVTSMKQGAWTDIYALAAVVYFAITGKTPVPSVGRMISDQLVPLSEAAAGRYSASFLQCIDKSLAVRPEDRPQDIEQLRTLLGQTERRQDRPSPLITPAGAIAETPKTPAYTKRKQRLALYTIAVAAVIIAVIGSFLFFRERPTDTPAKIKLVPETEIPARPPDSHLVVKEPFDPVRALDEVFENRDRDHAVTVSAEKAQVRIGKDELRFSIRSSKPGYVYLLMVGTNRSDFFLLFPNAVDKSNRISADRQLDLPRPKWKMVAAGPPGTDHFVVLVSNQQRDFRAAGLKTVDPFAELPLDQAIQLYRAYTGTTPLFAGKAVCPIGTTVACSESYGAAVFSIGEVLETNTTWQEPSSPPRAAKKEYKS